MKSILALIAMLVLVCVQQQANADQPNIIVILADDQGYFASAIEIKRHEKGISSVIFGDFKLMQSDPN